MLKSNFDNYPRGAFSRTLMHDFLGTGIFNSDGENWKIQHKIASHEFNTRCLKSFIVNCIAVELQGRLIPLLASAAETARVLDFQDILERFGFNNVCKVSFNVDPGCLDGNESVTGDFMKAFDDAAALSLGRFMSAVPRLYKIKKLLNLGSEKNLQKSIGIVHDFVECIFFLRGLKAPFIGFTKTAEIWNSGACRIGLIGTPIVELEVDLGTISLGILYVSFVIFSIVASLVVKKLGSKNALMESS